MTRYTVPNPRQRGPQAIFGRKYRGTSSAVKQTPVVVLPVLEGQAKCETCGGGVRLVSGDVFGISGQVLGAHYFGGSTTKRSRNSVKCIGSHTIGYVQQES